MVLTRFFYVIILSHAYFHLFKHTTYWLNISHSNWTIYKSNISILKRRWFKFLMCKRMHFRALPILNNAQNHPQSSCNGPTKPLGVTICNHSTMHCSWKRKISLIFTIIASSSSWHRVWITKFMCKCACVLVRVASIVRFYYDDYFHFYTAHTILAPSTFFVYSVERVKCTCPNTHTDRY